MADFEHGGAPHVEDKAGQEAFKIWLNKQIVLFGGKANHNANIKELKKTLSSLKAKKKPIQAEIVKEKAEAEMASEMAQKADDIAKKELADYVFKAFKVKLDLRKSLSNLQREVKKLERKNK